MVLFICAFLSLLQLHVVWAEKRLVTAYAVYRHGNRTAASTFPTNPFVGWKGKFRTLTKIGMKTQYELGQALRERYITTLKFLSPTYDKDEVYIRSTSNDIHLMSADLQAAGMYPPAFDERWHSDLAWRPIPVHSVEYEQDYLLRPFAVDCKKERRWKRKILTSNDYLSLARNNKKFIEQLSELAGVTYTFENISSLGDVLEKQLENNKPVPTFATPELVDKLLKLQSSRMLLLYASSFPMIKKIYGGHLLYTIAHGMEEKISASSRGEKRGPKLFLYSGHYNTLVGLMNVLNIPVADYPVYGECLSMELYEDGADFIVEIHSRSEASGFKQLSLSGCPSPCTFKQFHKKYLDWFIIDPQIYCENSTKTDYFGGFVFMLIFSILAAIIIAFLLRRMSTNYRATHKRNGYLTHQLFLN